MNVNLYNYYIHLCNYVNININYEQVPQILMISNLPSLSFKTVYEFISIFKNLTIRNFFII